ncbi:MAG: DUF4401 domain-containing protein [Flavobacteriaceae bacterium]
MISESDLKEKLQSIQLSEGDKFEYDTDAILKAYQKNSENKSGLAIKILSILGSFLAMLAFGGFLYAAGLSNSKYGLLLFGLVFIIVAVLMNKENEKLIVDTLSASLYIIGFALLSTGLSVFKLDDNIISLVFIVTAFLALYITQNYILSFISIIISGGSLLSLILINENYNTIHIYILFYALSLVFVFLNEPKIIIYNKKLGRLYNPLRIGVLFSFLVGLIFIGKRNLIPISQIYMWVSSIVMFSAVIYMVYKILDVLKINSLKNKMLIYTLCIFILLPTLYAPAISGAILILLMSFYVNYKTGLVIGVIALIYFVSQYYYDLNFTLLTKSILLFSSGLLFLIFYLILSKNTLNEKV